MKYLKQIEAYWERRMDAAEMEAFEKEMGENAQLRDEMKAYEASLHLLEWNSTGQLNLKKQPRPIGRWLGIAAAILLAVGLALFAYANRYYAPARLAAEHYTPPLLSSLERGAKTDAEATAAMQAFAEEAYAGLIAELSTADSLSPTLSYLLAHAYYQTAEWRAAEAQFSKIIQTDGTTYQHGARWYLALTLLQAGKMADARLELNSIRQDADNPKRERAAALLERLDSRWQWFADADF